MAALLAFVLHPKPKVRKAAQKAVALLVHSEGVSIVAVEEVATFVANELKRATKDQHTLQLLTFLRVVIMDSAMICPLEGALCQPTQSHMAFLLLVTFLTFIIAKVQIDIIKHSYPPHI